MFIRLDTDTKYGKIIKFLTGLKKIKASKNKIEVFKEKVKKMSDEEYSKLTYETLENYIRNYSRRLWTTAPTI